MTQNTIGPRKLTIARPISAPYSSCHWRIDSGETSKPARVASTTKGLRAAVELIAHALPALQRRVVGVHHRAHHGADVEGLLAAGVLLVGEDVADRRKLRARR